MAASYSKKEGEEVGGFTTTPMPLTTGHFISCLKSKDLLQSVSDQYTQGKKIPEQISRTLQHTLYLCDANFCLNILQPLLQDGYQSSRWDNCAIDASLMYVALKTKGKGTVLEP